MLFNPDRRIKRNNHLASNVMNTYGRYPLTIDRGQGVFLYDDQNTEFIDCAAGIATCCLGKTSILASIFFFT